MSALKVRCDNWDGGACDESVVSTRTQPRRSDAVFLCSVFPDSAVTHCPIHGRVVAWVSVKMNPSGQETAPSCDVVSCLINLLAAFTGFIESSLELISERSCMVERHITLSHMQVRCVSQSVFASLRSCRRRAHDIVAVDHNMWLLSSLHRAQTMCSSTGLPPTWGGLFVQCKSRPGGQRIPTISCPESSNEP